MNIFTKKYFILLIVLLCVLVASIFNFNSIMYFLYERNVFNSFAGILYPKKVFSFEPLYNVPSDPDDRLKAGANFPQTFTFFISRTTMNGFKYYFLPTTFVNKAYRILYIKEMTYDWEGNTGVILKNKIFQLKFDRYINQDGWFYLSGGMGRLKEVNFEKLFKDKNPGDKFIFKLKLVYSFDNESDDTLILDYNVITLKGKYIFGLQ